MHPDTAAEQLARARRRLILWRITGASVLTVVLAIHFGMVIHAGHPALYIEPGLGGWSLAAWLLAPALAYIVYEILLARVAVRNAHRRIGMEEVWAEMERQLPERWR